MGSGAGSDAYCIIEQGKWMGFYNLHPKSEESFLMKLRASAVSKSKT